MGWIGLATVMLSILKHYLDNKTPEAKKAYVKNLERMSKALSVDDVDDVNSLFIELREQAREGDTFGIGSDTEPGRDVHRQ
jgi:hypothetical protein